MNTQPEALWLAECLDNCASGDEFQRIADRTAKELVRLHEVNQELVRSLNLALKYWSDRQQRYKNRHPVWVESAHAALIKAGESA